MNIKKLAFLDVFRDVSGGNIKTPQKEFLQEGEIPVVDQGQQLVAGYVNDRSRICNAKPPVIVFGDHTRAIKYVDFEFAMGADGTKVLLPKVESDTKYLYYALSYIEIPAAGYSRHYKFLKKTQIPLPPLAEQKRIAGILDAADVLRAKRRESLAQLDTLLQSAFLDMFGDPVTNPMEWEMKPLGSVATLQRGFDLPVQKRREGRVPIFAANGPVGTHEVHKVRGPGVITGRSGTLGKVHYVEENFWPLNTALWVKNFHGNDPVWVCNLLSWMRLEQFTRGAGVPTLNRNLVHVVEIPLPPLELQHRFATIVESIEQQKASQRAHLAELDTLFASLQQRAFNGEL